MKLAPDAVDVHKRQFAGMGAICQKDENSLAVWVEPAARTREPTVPEAVRRQILSRHGIFSSSQLPPDRSRFFQPFSHVLPKELAGFGVEQFASLSEELIRQYKRFRRG